MPMWPEDLCPEHGSSGEVEAMKFNCFAAGVLLMNAIFYSLMGDMVWLGCLSGFVLGLFVCAIAFDLTEKRDV